MTPSDEPEGLTKAQYREVETMFKDEISGLKKWLEETFVTKESCTLSKGKCQLHLAQAERKRDHILYVLSIAIIVALGLKGIDVVGHILKLF